MRETSQIGASNARPNLERIGTKITLLNVTPNQLNTWPLHRYLSQGIWHTTHPERFLQIMKDGVLKAEPDLAEKERWKTSRGPDFYPLVRKIGGISLFDFTMFDPHSYSTSHPMSSWQTFVPHQENWRGAVWIEIDYDSIAERFISADQLVDR